MAFYLNYALALISAAMDEPASPISVAIPATFNLNGNVRRHPIAPEVVQIITSTKAIERLIAVQYDSNSI